MEAKKISKKREKVITKEYENFMYNYKPLSKSPCINTNWEKKNGMFVKYSLYANIDSSSSNGNANLLNI